MDDTIEESADGYNDNKSCYSLFPKLKVLQIEECNQLQFILPILSARDFLFLEVIKIKHCHKLEYIFDQHQDVKLTSLRTMEIYYLPNFIDIFPPNASSISKHGSKPQTQLGPIKGNTFSLCCYKYKLKSTKIPFVSEDQPQQCSISLESNSYCNIKEIKIFNVSKIKSVFIPSIALRMLETLTIHNCDELTQIIDNGDHNSTSGNNFGNVFPKLKWLEVRNCVQLEYIFALKECSQLVSGDFIKESSGNEENRQQMNLTLESIWLFDLPMMTCLFVGLKYSFVLKNLKKMIIVRCEKMEIVFSTSVLRCLPQLVNLHVQECKELKHIIEDDLEDKNSQSSNTFFPKLETLIVEKCDKLKNVFPVSICKEFPELKVMLIREAKELEEIFKSDKKEISKTEVEIPNLKAVGFAYLPSLCHTQGVHFQTVKYRFVLGCQKLSLTSATSDTFDDDIRGCSLVGYYVYLYHRLQKIQRECYEEVSEHKLTSPQELMNEQLMDQHPLGETDTIKPSQGYNLEGSTSEITAAETVSTITETKNKPPKQEVGPKQKGIQINAEEGTASANAKTITSSTHLDVAGSSSGQLVTYECKTSSQEDGDSQIATTSFSISTAETNDQGSLNDDSFKKLESSNIDEQFPKDDDIIVSKSKPSPSITSPVVYQFPPLPCKEDSSQKVEDLSSLLVKSELEQLVSKNHLDCGNLSLLTDFFVKHPSVCLKDTSLGNRYKGCAYNLLAELLKFLKTHNVLEVLGSFHSEFMELLQDAHSFGFDKDWLDGVERRALFPDIQVSQDALHRLLDSKQQVTKDVEVLRLKISILSQQVEDLKQQLTSSEAVLETIIQQEVALSAPIGY